MGCWTKRTMGAPPTAWSTAAMRSTEERPAARFSPVWPASSLPTYSSIGASPWVSVGKWLLGPFSWTARQAGYLPALLTAFRGAARPLPQGCLYLTALHLVSDFHPSPIGSVLHHLQHTDPSVPISILSLSRPCPLHLAGMSHLLVSLGRDGRR